MQNQTHGIPVLILQTLLQYAFQLHHNEFLYVLLKGNHVLMGDHQNHNLLKYDVDQDDLKRIHHINPKLHAHTIRQSYKLKLLNQLVLIHLLRLLHEYVNYI